MKKTLLTIMIVLIATQPLFSQLVLLIGQESKKVSENLEVFNQYNFSLVYSKEIKEYIIKSIDGKIDYFIPNSAIYYETFNKVFLLATELDSSYIHRGASEAPFFTPRRKVYIIPINTIQKKTNYFVNFGNKVINQESGKNYFEKEYFLIKEINFKKKWVIIYNPKTKLIKKLRMYKNISPYGPS